MRKFRLWGLLALLCPALHAVESGWETNVYDTTPPTDPTAWNYVGTVSGTSVASGVYLGDYNGTNWVLTAAHIGAGSFTLNGTTYDAIADSSFGFSLNGTQADLTLYEISGSPGLSNLTLASSNQPTGTTVQMIGYGGGKSWADNTIYEYGDYTLEPQYDFGGPGIVVLASGEGGNGGQGVTGDSGGGMFYESDGTWVLNGILSGIGDFTSGDTDLGEGTVAVDLKYYSGAIMNEIDTVSAIPEPSLSAAIFGAAALLATAILSRRRASPVAPILS